jgi:hypothetical protein
MKNNICYINPYDESQYIEFLQYYVDIYYDKLEILFEKVINDKNNIKKNKETILKLLITLYVLNKY